MQSPAAITTIILAGQRRLEQDLIAQQEAVPAKIFAKLGGRTLIDHVLCKIDQLAQQLTHGVITGSKIILIDPPATVAQHAPRLHQALSSGEWRSFPTAASPVTSLQRILADLPVGQPIMLISGDHPLLATRVIAASLGQFLAADMAIAPVMVPLTAVTQHGPNRPRTGLKFADGALKSCNLFFFRTPEALAAALAIWGRVEDLRKRPLHLLAFLGLGLALRYALGRLTQKAALAHLSRLSGQSVAAIFTDDGLAACDIDTPSDLEWARNRCQHPAPSPA